ncbi:MAG: histone deacetylase [Pseudomonadota bacterium]
MKKTGYLHDIRYLLHVTGPYHPEVPKRLTAIHSGIKNVGLLKHLIEISAVRADIKWIKTVHSTDYIQRFEKACLSGKSTFDCRDNSMCADTYETSLLAVGGILETIKLMMEGKIDNAFCAVRPPGHHAEATKAMGFCYFNNVAIAARYLQMQWKIKRVGIVDFDVHHGNGTQHIFENDPTVFFYSIHQHPSFTYPGTGREFEEGIQEGKGFTKNSPVLPGQSDDTYKHLIRSDLLPAFEKFKPEVILVSAGFDAHKEDRMADMNLSTEGFSWIMKTIMDLSETYTGGRLISVLEGGYSLRMLSELAANHVRILLNG